MQEIFNTTQIFNLSSMYYVFFALGNGRHAWGTRPWLTTSQYAHIMLRSGVSHQPPSVVSAQGADPTFLEAQLNHLNK
jgi:hypothetical protein